MRENYLHVDCDVLSKVNTLTEARVLFYMAQMAVPDGQIQMVYLTTADRKELLEKLHLSQAQFTRVLKTLLELGLVDGVDGRYIIKTDKVRLA